MTDREIGVQVAVRLLGLPDDLDELIRLGDVLRFAVICAIGNSLKPFIGIGITEHDTAVLALERAAEAMRKLSMQKQRLWPCLPLRISHCTGIIFFCNHVRVMAEQRIRYSNFFQIGIVILLAIMWNLH